MKEWFKARNIWGAAILALPDAEAGKIMKALFTYTMSNGDDEYAIDGAGKGLVAMMTATLDLDTMMEAETASKRSAAGALGGKQTKAKEANANFASENEANEANACIKNKNKNKESEEEEEKEKEKEQKREKEKEKESRSARFDLFWSIYPRKVGKEDARKAFDKLNPDDEMLDMILAAIGKQKVSSQWTENGGQFIPHPSTWLNGKRWNDDVVNYQSSKPPAPVKKTSQDYEQRDPVMADDAARQQFLAMLRGAGVT